MRAKVIIIAFFLALAVLAPALYFHFKTDSPATEVPAVATEPEAAQPATGGIPPILRNMKRESSQGGPVSAPSVRPAQMDHDTYIQEKQSQLIDLGMSANPESLRSILPELENTEPEIRRAALSATVQLGCKEAIPQLQNELAWATDLEEKMEIQKAIDFLQLPSMGSDDNDSVTQSASSGRAPATN